MSKPKDRDGHRLAEVSRALTYAASQPEILELTLQCAADLVGASTALVMLSASDGLLRITASRGVVSERAERFQEPLDESLLDRLGDLLDGSARDRFIGVPLIVRGQVIGILGVCLEPDGPTDEESEWLLSAVGDQAAVALEGVRQRELRRELEGRVGELERQRSAKVGALDILSHDLRSPMNAIKGYVSLLNSEVLGPVSERQREALRRVSRVSEHLESILDNVLQMARLTDGDAALEVQPVRIEDVVDEALEIVQPAAATASITLERTGAPTPALHSDPARVRQVLVQLLDNAVKYSPDGSHVRVTWKTIEADGAADLEIRVTDEGPGVAPDVRDDIFKPYVRRPVETARSHTGAGLGLAIARSVVQRLGGALTVEGRDKGGSSFVIRLPFAAAGSSAHHEGESGDPRHVPGGAKAH